MRGEYVGEILPDGHLSGDERVFCKIRPGQKLRVVLSPLPTAGESGAAGGKQQVEAFLAYAREASCSGGYSQGEITRDFIHERDV